MNPDLTRKILAFREARDWRQFHTPRTLAASLVLEAAELLEVFQWAKDAEVDALAARKREQIEQELGDITIYLTLMAHDLGIDLERAAERKLELNEQKYPASVVRGRPEKYTEYSDDTGE
jgi:NTP pyrophosphatase (non-canonical NTP hydrolase)